MQDSLDVKFMTLALREAEKAEKLREVPVGAILALDGRVIARGHNRKEFSVSQDPTAHAEIIALRKAAKKLKSWRMAGASLLRYARTLPHVHGRHNTIEDKSNRVRGL